MPEERRENRVDRAEKKPQVQKADLSYRFMSLSLSIHRDAEKRGECAGKFADKERAER